VAITLLLFSLRYDAIVWVKIAKCKREKVTGVLPCLLRAALKLLSYGRETELSLAFGSTVGIASKMALLEGGLLSSRGYVW